jgi:hypothetical protein
MTQEMLTSPGHLFPLPFVSLSSCVVPLDPTHLAIPILVVVVVVVVVVIHTLFPAVIYSGESGCCCGHACRCRPCGKCCIVCCWAPCSQYATHDPPHQQLFMDLEIGGVSFGTWCLGWIVLGHAGHHLVCWCWCHH